MLAQLEVIAGADRGRVFPLSSDAPLVIGRGRQSLARLDDPHVSRVHCQVELRGPDIVIKDLDSVCGTRVNGHTVTEQILHLGDVIQLGATKLRLECADLADEKTLPPERPVEDIPLALPADVTPPPRKKSRKTAIRPAELPASDHPPAKALPAAIPVSEALPAAIPITDALPAAMPAPQALKILSGERLGELTGAMLGPYQVGPVIARGKSGVVFHAVDPRNNLRLALKVLRPEFTRHEAEVQRFIRSMKTMLPLRNPNLISLFCAGKKGPYCWVAMEHVEGESLSQVIQRIGVAGMLDWRHAFHVAIHVARALDFAHQRRIVHRNLTPQNVLIRAADRLAKLGDLMLAKATEGIMAQQITQANEMLGDLRYMSPEQTCGPDAVDARSDLYSLGALLYACLTGHPPFEGDNVIDTIVKIRQAAVAMPKKYQMSIPDAFQAVVLHLLAKRPEERFQSAAELLRELERVGKFHGVSE
jgi:hypothetical protein